MGPEGGIEFAKFFYDLSVASERDRAVKKKCAYSAGNHLTGCDKPRINCFEGVVG